MVKGTYRLGWPLGQGGLWARRLWARGLWARGLWAKGDYGVRGAMGLGGLQVYGSVHPYSWCRVQRPLSGLLSKKGHSGVDNNQNAKIMIQVLKIGSIYI